MRKDLVLFINTSNILTVFQTETPIREEVSKLKAVTDIQDLLRKKEIKYMKGVYTPSSTLANISYFNGIVGKVNVKTNTYERNIHIINNSELGVKISFGDKDIDKTKAGMYVQRRLDSIVDKESLEVYCGANHYKHLELRERYDSDKSYNKSLEYITVKNTLL